MDSDPSPDPCKQQPRGDTHHCRSSIWLALTFGVTTLQFKYHFIDSAELLSVGGFFVQFWSILIGTLSELNWVKCEQWGRRLFNHFSMLLKIDHHTEWMLPSSSSRQPPVPCKAPCFCVVITAKTVRSKWFTLWWCPVSIKITSDFIIQSQIRPVPLSELMKIISPLKKSQKYFPVWSKIFPCQYVYGCGCWQAAGAGLSGNVIVCSVMCKELFIQHSYFTCIWAALSNKTTLSHHMLRGFIRLKVSVVF